MKHKGDLELLKQFAENLKRIRKYTGVSQENLSNEAGLAKNQVGLIERGRVSPTLTTMGRLAKRLGVHIHDFFDKDSKC